MAAPARASISGSMIRSAAKAYIPRTRSPSACFSTNSINAIRSSSSPFLVSGVATHTYSKCRR